MAGIAMRQQVTDGDKEQERERQVSEWLEGREGGHSVRSAGVLVLRGTAMTVFIVNITVNELEIKKLVCPDLHGFVNFDNFVLYISLLHNNKTRLLHYYSW